MVAREQEVPLRIYKAVLISTYIKPGPAQDSSDAGGAAGLTLRTDVPETKHKRYVSVSKSFTMGRSPLAYWNQPSACWPIGMA